MSRILLLLCVIAGIAFAHAQCTLSSLSYTKAYKKEENCDRNVKSSVQQ